jgi:hypothetical protein
LPLHGNNGEGNHMLGVEEADKNHRLLQNSIPQDDNSWNWSIPLLRMAQQLQGSWLRLQMQWSYMKILWCIYIPITSALVTAGIEDAYNDLSIRSRGSSLCNFDDFGW